MVRRDAASQASVFAKRPRRIRRRDNPRGARRRKSGRCGARLRSLREQATAFIGISPPVPGGTAGRPGCAGPDVSFRWRRHAPCSLPGGPAFECVNESDASRGCRVPRRHGPVCPLSPARRFGEALRRTGGHCVAPVPIRHPSSIAAKVATAPTKAPLHSRSTAASVSGSRKSSIPVALFDPECTTANSPRMAYPKIALNALIAAIAIIQTASQAGTSMAGTSLIRHATNKAKSAAVSSFAPNPLAVPVFRAIAPSAMSLSPATMYRA